jgi:Uma2 family endonuclease
MAETDKHADVMVYLKEALRAHYAERPDVYISGNNFVFFEEGNPKARVSPDCYVVFGVPMRQRDSYMTWKEGNHRPSVVFEITSRKTKTEDLTTKVSLYEQTLRVPEYFMFDPNGDYLTPRLQGRRLIGNRYATLEPEDDRIYSVELGLDLIVEGDFLRLYDPATDTLLPSPPEMAERARREASRADAAEAEIARLRAELESLRRGEQA